MSQLQDRAPTHSPAFSAAAVRQAFGCEAGQLFESFEPAAIASGSIAQVVFCTYLYNTCVRV